MIEYTTKQIKHNHNTDLREDSVVHAGDDGSPLQHTATHCNILQHTATHCNALQHIATQVYARILQCMQQITEVAKEESG